METIKIKSNNPNLEGGACVFYTIIMNKKKVGVKIYNSLKEAKYAHKLQTIAAQFNIGPEVLSKVSIVKYKPSNSGYGYVTQLAKVLDSLYRVSDNEKNVLMRKFKSVFGLEYSDIHEGNLGFINGKLVIIDFDDCSINP